MRRIRKLDDPGVGNMNWVGSMGWIGELNTCVNAGRRRGWRCESVARVGRASEGFNIPTVEEFLPEDVAYWVPRSSTWHTMNIE